MTTDPDVQDENGLYPVERAAWLRCYRAITDMMDCAVFTTPSQAEALRRMKLIHLEASTRIKALEASE